MERLNKMMRYTCLLLCALLFVACQSASNSESSTPVTTERPVENSPQNSSPELSAALSDEGLQLTVNGHMQTIAEEGAITGYHIAPDQGTLVLDVSKLSTLSVVSLYTFNPATNYFEKEQGNSNTEVWRQVSQKHNVASDDFLRSSVSFLEWKGNDYVLLTAIATTGDGSRISDTVQVQLPGTRSK